MAGMLARANGARAAGRLLPARLPKASSAARAGEFRVTPTAEASATVGVSVGDSSKDGGLRATATGGAGGAVGAVGIGAEGIAVVTGSRV